MKSNLLINHFIMLSDDEVDWLLYVIEFYHENMDVSRFPDELQSVYEKLEDVKL